MAYTPDFAKLSADLKGKLADFKNASENYTDGEDRNSPEFKALDEALARLLDVLAAITRGLSDNPPNTLEGTNKAMAVGAAMGVLMGLSAVDRIHPDFWDLREEYSVKYLKAHGVDVTKHGGE